MSVVLKSVSYFEKQGRPLEWALDGLQLGAVNLLVGKNATGKSRTLNIISNLAKHFQRPTARVRESGYDVVFDWDGNELKYTLNIVEKKVVKEHVTLNGEEKLLRDESELKIYAERLGDFITFEPQEDEVAASARRDKRQHPFLLPFGEWAQSVRRYNFGSSLGKDNFGIRIKAGKATEVDDRDERQVVVIFGRGKRSFGKDYTDLVLQDMATLGYDLSEIDVNCPEHIEVAVGTPIGKGIPIESQLLAIGVREKGIDGMFYQDSISQGMFRALSILAQVNYSQMSERANCILIDDIGEGLDFDRSSSLIDLLRKKAETSKFQLIMATNDQFVMNHVPLEEWSVLQREGGHVKVRNIHNSREEFEHFRFVGMSNFAFFEMDFLNSENVEGAALQYE